MIKMGSWSQEGVPAGTFRFLSFGCGLPPNPVRHPWKHARGSGFCVRFSEIYLVSAAQPPAFKSQTLADRPSHDSRTTGVCQISGVIRNLNLFLMTKLTLMVTLNNPHDT